MASTFNNDWRFFPVSIASFNHICAYGYCPSFWLVFCLLFMNNKQLRNWLFSNRQYLSIWKTADYSSTYLFYCTSLTIWCFQKWQYDDKIAWLTQEKNISNVWLINPFWSQDVWLWSMYQFLYYRARSFKVTHWMMWALTLISLIVICKITTLIIW